VYETFVVVFLTSHLQYYVVILLKVKLFDEQKITVCFTDIP